MKQIYYCKSLKRTGKPIVVIDLETGKETHVNKIEGHGNWKVEFKNATGKAKRSGATTMLLVEDESV